MEALTRGRDCFERGDVNNMNLNLGDACVVLTGCLARTGLPNDSAASNRRACRRLTAVDAIPVPTSLRRFECDSVSYPVIAHKGEVKGMFDP